MKELNKSLSSFDFRCGLHLSVDISGQPVAVYKKLETRYKKQEGEAPAAPIL